MTRGRYGAAAASVARALSRHDRGIGVVIVPTGEQAIIAALVQEQTSGAIAGPDVEQWPSTRPGPLIVVGLPEGDKAAVTEIEWINSRRSFLPSHVGIVALVLSLREALMLQKHAPDVYSALAFRENVAFEPDPGVDERSARATLMAHLRERYGRLDLATLLGGDTPEDAPRVEDVFLDAHATLLDNALPTTDFSRRSELSVPEWIDTLDRDRPFVVIGHPGSGKTCLLRWLALTAGSVDSFFDVEEPIPVIIPLATYARGLRLPPLMAHAEELLLTARQPAAHVLRRAAASGRAMFLLDGLDEAPGDAARGAVADALSVLATEAPGCVIVVTSRVTGYRPGVIRAHELMLSPFDKEHIVRFLQQWHERREIALHGDSAETRKAGGARGERIALEILSHESIRALAESPLLLTVLAAMSGIGGNLPAHRIELYAQLARVLIERWGRMRSLTQEHGFSLRWGDALRLLGPLALEVTQSATHAIIPEERLRAHVERAIRDKLFRGITSVDEALTLFRGTLGLFVETAPNVYAFLHPTLAEYFAALELARSEDLFRFAKAPKKSYSAKLREVFLLAAGELGVLRADDERLDRLVSALVEAADLKSQKPTPDVPALLASLLADDPALSDASAKLLRETLIPGWWFDRIASQPKETLFLTLAEATKLAPRIRDGRFGADVLQALADAYFGGKTSIEPTTMAHEGDPRYAALAVFQSLGGEIRLSGRKHFLDELPLDWSRPEPRRLLETLTPAIHNIDEMLMLAVRAGIPRTRIRWDGAGVRVVWRDVLEVAQRTGTLRPLLDRILEDPTYRSVHRALREMLHAGTAAIVTSSGPLDEQRSAVLTQEEEEKEDDDDSAERTFLRPGRLDISFLSRGLALSRGVVRVRADGRRGPGYGTGFLIARDIVLTAYHVLFSMDDSAPAERVSVDLDFDSEPSMSTQLVTDTATICGEAEADWAVIRLLDPAPTTATLVDLSSPGAVERGDPVFIIHHPSAGPKKIQMTGVVRHVDESVVQYLSFTEGGSSGAPVFNGRWEIVGLHHRSVEAPRAKGRPEIRQQAINIQRVVEGLRRHGILPDPPRNQP